MITTYSDDYLYSVDIDTINNVELVDQCLKIEYNLLKNLGSISDPGWYGNVPSAHNDKYNLLTYANREFSILYREMIKHISPFLEQDECYVLKSWLNVYRVGESVKWHGHWKIGQRVWHGFYCAQVGDSSTYYKIPGVDGVITVPSKEGRLVFGRSEGDQHRSSDWEDTTKPRITLAFDIVPIESVSGMYPNHFIPFHVKY